MSFLEFAGFFLAGMATLVAAIPRFASDGKIRVGRFPAALYRLSARELLVLNVLSLLPAIVVMLRHGLFSWPTLVVGLGVVLGAFPCLLFLLFDDYRSSADAS